MQVRQMQSGPQPRVGNHRPADPGLSPTEDPVDTCTWGRPTHVLPGETHWKMQLALANSDYRGQQRTARGLLEKAQRNELLTADEQAALRNLAGVPQANGSVTVAAYHQSEKSVGPAKVYQKSEIGYEVGRGVYVAGQTGAELKVGLPGLGPSATAFTRTTTRSGQEQSETQAGVEFEKSLGPASVGASVSNQGLGLMAKIESPAVAGQRVGVSADVAVPTRGNATAREIALRALHQHTSTETARNWGLH